MEVRAAEGERAPGRIIRCPSVPDRHIAVTHDTGTTFGARAGFQRICHTLLIDGNAEQWSTHPTQSPRPQRTPSFQLTFAVTYFLFSRFVKPFRSIKGKCIDNNM